MSLEASVLDAINGVVNPHALNVDEKDSNKLKLLEKKRQVFQEFERNHEIIHSKIVWEWSDGIRVSCIVKIKSKTSQYKCSNWNCNDGVMYRNCYALARLDIRNFHLDINFLCKDCSESYLYENIFHPERSELGPGSFECPPNNKCQVLHMTRHLKNQ